MQTFLTIAGVWLISMFFAFSFSYVCHVLRCDDIEELEHRWNKFMKREATAWYIFGAPIVLFLVSIDLVLLVLGLFIMKYVKYFMKNSKTFSDINIKDKDFGTTFAEMVYASRNKEDK